MLATSGTQAATFSADTAVANSIFSSDYVAENTINGSGLPGGFGPTDTHADYAQGNHWTSNGASPTDEYIEWGFSSVKTVGGLYIWNHLSNIIASNSVYEPISFDLTFKDGGGGTLLEFEAVSLTPDTNGASESFTLSAPLSNVGSVLFEVKATQGSPTYTGLAEVLFSDSVIAGADVTLNAVPLPAPAWLLLAGMAGMAGVRRLRR